MDRRVTGALRLLAACMAVSVCLFAGSLVLNFLGKGKAVNYSDVDNRLNGIELTLEKLESADAAGAAKLSEAAQLQPQYLLARDMGRQIDGRLCIDADRMRQWAERELPQCHMYELQAYGPEEENNKRQMLFTKDGNAWFLCEATVDANDPEGKIWLVYENVITKYFELSK